MRTQRPTLGLAPALPGIVLVIIIAWALAAVLMLTGTLLNAREIKDDVDVINGQVSPIDKDLQSVALAAETVKISARINAAAQPLSGQARQILQAATRINASARSILTTAGSINQTVRQINGTVTQINGTVVSINGKVAAIGGAVGSIFSRVQTIGGRVATIRRSVGPQNATDQSINANVARINQVFVDLDPVTRSIDTGGTTGGVAGINMRANRAQQGAAAIKGDFVGIIGQVGFPASPAGHVVNGKATIHGHANSIDCAPLINNTSGASLLPLVGFLQTLVPTLTGTNPAVSNPTPYCNR